jgi:hypothetical protein
MSLFQDKVKNLEKIVEELKSKDEREDTDEYTPVRMKPVECHNPNELESPKHMKQLMKKNIIKQKNIQIKSDRNMNFSTSHRSKRKLKDKRKLSASFVSKFLPRSRPNTAHRTSVCSRRSSLARNVNIEGVQLFPDELTSKSGTSRIDIFMRRHNQSVL